MAGRELLIATLQGHNGDLVDGMSSCYAGIPTKVSAWALVRHAEESKAMADDAREWLADLRVPFTREDPAVRMTVHLCQVVSEHVARLGPPKEGFRDLEKKDGAAEDEAQLPTVTFELPSTWSTDSAETRRSYLLDCCTFEYLELAEAAWPRLWSAVRQSFAHAAE